MRIYSSETGDRGIFACFCKTFVCYLSGSDFDVDCFFFQVSKQAKEFLEFVYEEPLLDIQQLNPCLYEHCEPLSTVLRLRQQLQSLRAYLFSCRATVAEDLRRR